MSPQSLEAGTNLPSVDSTGRPLSRPILLLNPSESVIFRSSTGIFPLIGVPPTATVLTGIQDRNVRSNGFDPGSYPLAAGAAWAVYGNLWLIDSGAPGGGSDPTLQWGGQDLSNIAITQNYANRNIKLSGFIQPTMINLPDANAIIGFGLGWSDAPIPVFPTANGDGAYIMAYAHFETLAPWWKIAYYNGDVGSGDPTISIDDVTALEQVPGINREFFVELKIRIPEGKARLFVNGRNLVNVDLGPTNTPDFINHASRFGPTFAVQAGLDAAAETAAVFSGWSMEYVI